MVLLVTNFLFNLFCGFIPCNPTNSEPSDPIGQLSRNSANFRQARGDPNNLDSNFIQNSSLSHSSSVILNPVVETLNGLVEGYNMKTIKRRDIYAFEGIPFAESTGGQNRFKAPVPKGKWNGIFPAKKIGPICLQLHSFRLWQIMGREDCLSLNIYTPILPDSEVNPKLPVIVFLHGGAFIFGSGSEYGPAYQLDNDIILVTINYRLGILGFLSTMDESSPGNYGLKDQALALKWVHENIENFGGDPSRVTLMGQSAGAASVHLHMISNRTRDYFQRGISMSGSALHHWAVLRPPRIRRSLEKLSNLTRCPLTPSQAFVQCLRNIDPFSLTGRQQFIWDWLNFPPVIFGPVVEKESEDSFLTTWPADAYANGQVAKIPWISSLTQDEGQNAVIIIYGFGIFGSVSNNFRKRMPYFVDYELSTNDTDTITDQIRDFYFGDQNPSDAETDPRIFGDISSDRFFFYHTHKALQAHSAVAPTYSYLFGYRGKYGLYSYFRLPRENWGTVHADDTFYIFNASTVYLDGFKTTDKDYAVVKLCSNLIHNFASTGEPLYTTEDGDQVKIWDKITNPDQIEQLLIDTEVKMVPEPHKKRLKFWESLNLQDIQQESPHQPKIN